MRYTIGELAEIIDGDRGKNYPQQSEFMAEGYCLFLNTGNVTTSGFSFESNQFITKEKSDLLRKGKLRRRDIVYTTRGTVGNAGFFSESVPYEHIRINSGMVIIRPKESVVCTEFLYQILKSSYYRSYFLQYCTGSAQPQLPIKNLSKIELDIPALEKQYQIANVLSAYDTLIENNQKQIKLLEEAAQRLYKEWFVDLRFPGHETTPVVDGVPEGWYESTVDDCSCILRRGISPKYSEDGSSIVINQKCIRQSVVDLNEARRQEKLFLPEMNLIDSDTVICSTGAGTLGRVGQIFGQQPNTTFDSHVTLVRASDIVGKQYLYQFLKSKQQYLQGRGKGSTNQLELNRATIQELVLLIPGTEIRDTFERQAQPIHDQITTLSKQIVLLQEARDKLLPKLMSREIEV